MGKNDLELLEIYMDMVEKQDESKDGEMWRKVVGYVITTIIGIAVGFMFTQIGM